MRSAGFAGEAVRVDSAAGVIIDIVVIPLRFFDIPLDVDWKVPVGRWTERIRGQKWLRFFLEVW